MRTRTHEIMNFVTPIASLASLSNDLLSPPAAAETPDNFETVPAVRNAVQSIQRRSVDLLHIVNSNRNLWRITKPNFQVFPVAMLFVQVLQLISAPPKLAARALANVCRSRSCRGISASLMPLRFPTLKPYSR